MGKYVFTDEVPRIQIRNGMVFIEPSEGHGEVATTPYVLRMFIERARRELDDWHRQQNVCPVEFPRSVKDDH